MKWTKETPTEAGWYWVREFDTGPVKMAELDNFLGYLLSEETGSDVPYRVSDYPNSTVWYGPIQPPPFDSSTGDDV